MNTRHVFVTFLLAVLSTSAGAQGRPTGLNCNLKEPPHEAGEESNHGLTLRIFPRAKDIDSTYSGCQTLFMPDKQGWVIVGMTEVIKGDPVRVWSEFEKEPKRLACRYAKGKVVRGDRDHCPAVEFILAKSMAPGCVERVGELIAENGLGTPLPRECAYE